MLRSLVTLAGAPGTTSGRQAVLVVLSWLGPGLACRFAGVRGDFATPRDQTLQLFDAQRSRSRIPCSLRDHPTRTRSRSSAPSGSSANKMETEEKEMDSVGAGAQTSRCAPRPSAYMADECSETIDPTSALPPSELAASAGYSPLSTRIGGSVARRGARSSEAPATAPQIDKGLLSYGKL